MRYFDFDRILQTHSSAKDIRRMSLLSAVIRISSVKIANGL